MTEPMFSKPIAHRGLHDRAKGVIENTASAFEAAIAGGYAIECDLQLTSDGVPIIFHDSDMKRLLGKDGAVADCLAAISPRRHCSTARLATAHRSSATSWPRSPGGRCCRSSSSINAIPQARNCWRAQWPSR
ncbi:MAG: glycerophosphodiester phosphodiesterase family protein [Devosia sp.]